MLRRLAMVEARPLRIGDRTLPAHPTHIVVPEDRQQEALECVGTSSRRNTMPHHPLDLQVVAYHQLLLFHLSVMSTTFQSRSTLPLQSLPALSANRLRTLRHHRRRRREHGSPPHLRSCQLASTLLSRRRPLTRQHERRPRRRLRLRRKQPRPRRSALHRLRRKRMPKPR